MFGTRVWPDQLASKKSHNIGTHLGGVAHESLFQPSCNLRRTHSLMDGLACSCTSTVSCDRARDIATYRSACGSASPIFSTSHNTTTVLSIPLKACAVAKRITGI